MLNRSSFFNGIGLSLVVMAAMAFCSTVSAYDSCEPSYAWCVCDDTLSHWKLDDNADSTAVSDELGNYGGFLYGGEHTDDTHQEGHVGTGCFHFDGDDWIDVGNLDAELTGDFAVAFWFRSHGVVEGEREFLFSALDSDSDGSGWIGVQINFDRRRRDGEVTASFFAGTEDSVGLLSDDPLDDGDWHFLVCTREGTTATLYIDGSVNDERVTWDSSISNPGTVSIGARPGGELGLSNGEMDDVRVFLRSLNAVEVQGLYNAGLGTDECAGQSSPTPTQTPTESITPTPTETTAPTPTETETPTVTATPTPGPTTPTISWSICEDTIAHYELEDVGSTHNVEDSIGDWNGYPINGHPASHFATEGHVGDGAFYFNGTGGVDIGELDEEVDGDFTVAFWFRTGSVAHGKREMLFSALGSHPTAEGWIGLQIILDDLYNDRIIGAQVYNGLTIVGPRGSEPVDDGQWRHAAVVREGTSLTLYLNAQMIDSSSKPGGDIPLENPKTTSFGSRPGGEWPLSDTAMDDIRVVGRAMAPTEIFGLYNEGLGTEECEGEYEITPTPTITPPPTPTLTPPPTPTVTPTPDAWEGWTYITLGLLPFTDPTASVGQEALQIHSTSNNLNFGFWHSPPEVAISPDTLYRTLWAVSTDVDDPDRVPALRLRVNASSFEQASTVNAYSLGAAASCPATGPTVYEMLFNAPQGAREEDTWRFSFDLINFYDDDIATGTIRLHALVVDLLAPDDITSATRVNTYDFEDGAGVWWYNVVGSPFTNPQGEWADGALRIVATGNDMNYGFWGSPLDSTPLEAGALYRARWTVGTDTSPANQVPGMRLRVNCSDYQKAFTHIIESERDGDNMPVPGSPRVYESYHAAPAHLAGDESWFYSFEMMNFKVGDNPNGALFLESLEVDLVELP